MPKEKKTPTLAELAPQVELLSTEDQLLLKTFIEKILESKKAAAKQEFDLISNGKA